MCSCCFDCQIDYNNEKIMVSLYLWFFDFLYLLSKIFLPCYEISIHYYIHIFILNIIHNTIVFI